VDICLPCIYEVRLPSSFVVVDKVWDSNEALTLKGPFYEIYPGEWSGSTLNVTRWVSGRPQIFVELVKTLGPDALWRINNSQVFPLQTFPLFGLNTCAMHVDFAIKLWQGRYRL
jgi:hypothetical protein